MTNESLKVYVEVFIWFVFGWFDWLGLVGFDWIWFDLVPLVG